MIEIQGCPVLLARTVALAQGMWYGATAPYGGVMWLEGQAPRWHFAANEPAKPPA